MTNDEQIQPKKVNPMSAVVGLVIWALVAISILFAIGGVAVLAIKWFFSLVKGGL